MTEVVDKTLIERLILEHSDRLELEINQKARADAWKFYYRVRVDHVIRPFAVCKVCFRVLHCDSRSGTASLLRHPCNPLSERSPVNRAVKLSAKLNLPVDTSAAALKGERLKGNTTLLGDVSIKEEALAKHEAPSTLSEGGNARASPVSLTTVASRASPTSTGSPPTAAQPTTTSSGSASVGSRKRKAAAPPPAFPLDLRFLQLPLVAAAAAHHLNPLNLTGLFSDPQRLQHLQQQLHQSQLEHFHRQQQQQHQQRELEREEQEAKRARREAAAQDGRATSPGSPSEASSSCWGRDGVKKERADTSEGAVPEDLRGWSSPSRYGGRARPGPEDGAEEGGGSMSKDVVQQLVGCGSPRITLSEKDAAGSHYISDVWARFSVVYVDGMMRPFAACKNCLKVVTYTKYSGTGGLLRHRCSVTDLNSRHHDGVGAPTEADSPPPSVRAYSPAPAHAAHAASPRRSPLSLALRTESDGLRLLPEELPLAPTAAMAGVARALLRYMCQDLVAASTLDSPAFQRLVWTVLNLGAAHGTFREEEPLPSAKRLLHTFLTPMAAESRSLIARAVLDQPNLCLSLNHDRELRLITGAIHFITPKFELRSYALGAHRILDNETEEESVTALLSGFFSDVLVPAAMRDKHVTVVSDQGTPAEPGVVGVRCVWHATEAVLEGLMEEPSYRQICKDVASVLAFLADSGVAGVAGCGLQPHEVRRWDALLHALTFITAHHDELCVVMAGCEGGAHLLGERLTYQEVAELLAGVRRCLLTVRDPHRPTLNQAVLCRAKLLQLCATPASSKPLRQIKQHLTASLSEALTLTPLHLVASFLDPRCKSLKVLTDAEKGDVHRHVLEMMKSVAVTEANSGVLNLKTHNRHNHTHHNHNHYHNHRNNHNNSLNKTSTNNSSSSLSSTSSSSTTTTTNTNNTNTSTSTSTSTAAATTTTTSNNSNNNNNDNNNTSNNTTSSPSSSPSPSSTNNNTTTTTDQSSSDPSTTSTNTSTSTTTSTTITSSTSSTSSTPSPEVHPFREYMDNTAPDTSVSDSEEIMAYVNMKVHLENDDILGWWGGASASGLSTLRLLARKILSVPATCAYAHDVCVHAGQARQSMSLPDETHLNNVLHMKYNMN